MTVLPAFVHLVAFALLVSTGSGIAHAQIDEGDRAWAARADVIDDGLAAPARIEAAIRRYRAALEAEPRSLEASWKLLRALHYAIDFTNLADRAKDARVAEAVDLASASTEYFEEITGQDSDRARLFFWSAIAWGTRAQRVGLLTIVREGAARRMHDYAERSLALDANVDRGGAMRLLSRLHATLPRVPFVSGWVDRNRALPLAERAYALDASHPGNQLILALALLDGPPDRESEARSLLDVVARLQPRTEYLVEDRMIREQARAQRFVLVEEAQ